MIRFIDLRGQITDGEKEFAFYDTITDQFLEFDGQQTFYTWYEFIDQYEKTDTYPLERFQTLRPKWVSND